MTDTLPSYYRRIDTTGIEPVNPDEGVGPPIKMQWISLDRLYVDTRYQRDIAKGAKSNVRQIGRKFKWRRFAPIIVTPIEGTDCFSVIDGQHKATGAKLRGLKEVPCGIVETASLEDQADSFKFLNANTTKIMLFDIFKANLAAKDPDAVAINALASECGVTFVSSKKFLRDMKQGECKTYKSFEALSRTFKSDIFKRAVTNIAANQTSVGIVNGLVIGSLCSVLKLNPTWLDNPGLDNALRNINLLALSNKAGARFKMEGGTQKAVLTGMLHEKIREKLNIPPIAI